MDWAPIIISLKTSITAISITFFAGVFTAKAVVNMKHAKGKMIIDGILTLPLVLPPTVAGFLLLCIFGIKRPIGSFLISAFGIKVVFTWSATVIAAVVVSFPLMYRSARGAFEQVDVNLVYAARTLGLSERSIFWRIIMPLALPGVASGAVLAFARGLGEFGATAMLAGNIAGVTRTLPMAIYSAVAAGNMEEAWNYVLIIVVLSFIVVVLMNYSTYKKKDPWEGGGF